AIRISARQNGGEVVVASGPGRSGAAQEGEVTLLVVTDRISIVGTGAQPAVASAAIILDAAALIGMVGVRVPTTLVVGSQRKRRVRHASAVQVSQACLPAGGTGQPPQKMIKG